VGETGKSVKVQGCCCPFPIESLEDGVDDAVHVGHVDKVHHGSSSAAHLDETVLDDIGSAQLLPQLLGCSEFTEVRLKRPRRNPLAWLRVANPKNYFLLVVATKCI
jgi:hypothetical protein